MTTSSNVALTMQLEAGSSVRTRTLWEDAWNRFWKNKLAVIGGVVIILFFLIALVGPFLAPYDFREQDIGNQFQGPTANHWFGTDALGRDIYSRLIYGARTAAIVAIVSTTISLLIGIAVGAAAGYARGRADELLMWLTDVVMSVPGLLLAMMINAAVKRPILARLDEIYQATKNPFFLNTLWLDFALLFGILALISWPGLARLVRGQVLSIGRTTYVESARAIGASPLRILSRHVVPNALGPLLVAVSAGMGGAIVAESALSWIGIGIPPPNASWGIMLRDSLQLWRSYPHLLIAPSVAIGLMSVAFTFFGDGLNDALNPRLQQK